MLKLRKAMVAFLSSILIVAIGVTGVSAYTYFVYGGFTYQIQDDKVIIFEYDDSNSNLVIPQTILGKEVAEIYNSTFEYDTEIISVSLPNTLTKIGTFAFRGASNIPSVVVPESCNTIGTAAFQSCTSLKTAEFKSNPTVINPQMFYHCSALAEFTVPDSVESIGSLAFADCPALEKVVIPESVNSIASNAFKRTDNVTLYVKENSYAMNFAIKNKIPYVIEREKLIGDVNLDGVLTIDDATLIQKYLAEFVDFSDEQIELADVNGDGFINIIDVTRLQQICIK